MESLENVVLSPECKAQVCQVFRRAELNHYNKPRDAPLLPVKVTPLSEDDAMQSSSASSSLARDEETTHPRDFDRYSLKLGFRDKDKSEGCLLYIEGIIMGHRKEAGPTKLGYIKAELVRASRARECGDGHLRAIIDGEYEDLAYTVRDLHGRNSGDWPFDNSADNILYISAIYLKAEYRGHDIGLLVCHSLISALPFFKTTTHATTEIDAPFVRAETEATDEHGDRNSGCMPDTDVVLLSEAGINLSDRIGPDVDHFRPVQILADHWARLGFGVIGERLEMISLLMGLKTLDRRPKIEDVVPHLME